MRYEPGEIIDTDTLPAEAVSEFVMHNSDSETEGSGVIVGVIAGLAFWAIVATLALSVWGA